VLQRRKSAVEEACVWREREKRIIFDSILKDFRSGTGSVAQIVRDSLRNSIMLVGVDEKTHTSDLSHDELAHL
jgi:hypothetical protein